MARYIASRVLQAVVVVVFIGVTTFLLLRLSPGSPEQIRAGIEASPVVLRQYAESFGTDRSIPQQFEAFVGDLAHGDLGLSIRYGTSVGSLIAQALPNTILLGLCALGLSLLVTFLLGVRAARRPGGGADVTASVLAGIGQATPVFWFGLVLIQIFAVQLGWLPSGGYDGPASLVLPAATVAMAMIPTQIRVLRSSLGEALGEEYVRTARSFGLRERRIAYVYALRNALLPVLTVVGVDIGFLLGGVIVAEVVFDFPGIGQLAISALQARDYPLIQALTLGSAAIFVAVNLLVDLLYSVIDPRVRLQS